MTTRLQSPQRSGLRHPSRPRRRGVAAVMAMLYLILFSILAVGFYSTVNTSAAMSHNDERIARTFLSAESGMGFMRYQMSGLNLPYGTNADNLLANVASSLAYNMDDTPNMGGEDVELADGAIWLPSKTGWISLDPTAKTRFRASITQTAGSKTLVVTVHGGTGGSEITRGIQLSYKPKSASYSLAGLSGVEMSGAAFTDSYDSTKGAYSGATAGTKGSIVTNGDIKLSGTVTIHGDARPGPTKTITLEGSASVTGRKTPIPTAVTYPSVTLPASYSSLGDVNVTSGTRNLPGGTYVIDDLTLGGDAVINWMGPVTLYIRNSYHVSGNVQINTYQNKPANRVLNFLPTCANASWTGTNICVGELYAPDTDFVISGNVQKLGRITARSIKNNSNGGMHADESLPSPAGGGNYVPDPATYLEIH